MLVPTSRWRDIMQSIHNSYLGIPACLRRHRDIVYCPRINEDRDYVSKCVICSAHQIEQGQEPLLPRCLTDHAERSQRICFNF